MPLFRIADRMIFFVHIPKTGGTSVESFLSGAGRMALHYDRRISGLGVTPQHFHANIYQKIIPEGFYDYSFCIVRNPFDRLVSEYAMRDTDDYSFDDWVKFIFSEYHRDAFVHDNHIRPQIDFIVKGIEIFRFEDGIKDILNRLATKLSLTPPIVDFHERKSLPTQVKPAETTLRLIEEFYAEDLQAFDYGFSDATYLSRRQHAKNGGRHRLRERGTMAPGGDGDGQLTVALFVPWITRGRGGTESVGAMIANGMAARGHRIHIHTFDDDRGEPTWSLHENVTVSHHPQADSEAADNQLLLELALQSPDLIVGLYMNRICFRYVYCGYRLNCPVLLSEHTDPNFADETGVLLRGERERIFACADQIHLLTDEFRSDLPPDIQSRATVIPNTVAVARKQGDPVGRGVDEKTVLCVARLVDRKNVDTLVSAFAKAVATTDDEWRLQVVGYGSLLDTLRAQAEALGVGSKVVFEGRQENAYPFYERAQFVVLPSYAEGLPLVPLEAMAHGLPCIGFSDCSGIPLLIEDGVTGLQVAREDQVANLADGISRLMADPALRSSMGTAAKLRYDTLFAPPLILDRWEALIRRVAAMEPRSQDLRRISRVVRVRVAIQAALQKGPAAYFAGRGEGGLEADAEA